MDQIPFKPRFGLAYGAIEKNLKRKWSFQQSILMEEWRFAEKCSGDVITLLYFRKQKKACLIPRDFYTDCTYNSWASFLLREATLGHQHPWWDKDDGLQHLVEKLDGQVSLDGGLTLIVCWTWLECWNWRLFRTFSSFYNVTANCLSVVVVKVSFITKRKILLLCTFRHLLPLVPNLADFAFTVQTKLLHWNWSGSGSPHLQWQTQLTVSCPNSPHVKSVFGYFSCWQDLSWPNQTFVIICLDQSVNGMHTKLLQSGSLWGWWSGWGYQPTLVQSI